jgi:hypothetical protein
MTREIDAAAADFAVPRGVQAKRQVILYGRTEHTRVEALTLRKFNPAAID